MDVFHKISDYEVWRSQQKGAGLSIGFVPTMGALHIGHISLIEASKRENDITVCSIYVNPTQFNEEKDFEKYPRLLEKDQVMLEKHGCDALFAPESEEMYPQDSSSNILKGLELGKLVEVMEGQFRPGHFQGVLTIVEKLFSVIQPDKAYFGYKDFQQLAVVKTMNDQLNLGINVIGCATIREEDGLALSSRNLLLSEEQRAEAPAIFKSLKHGKDHLKEYSVEEFKKNVTAEIEHFSTLNVEYVEVSDSKSLEPLNDWQSTDSAVCCVAVHAGDVRLIDNIILYN